MTIIAIAAGWIALSALVALFAHNRGRSPVFAVLAALVLSPVFGFLLVVALKNRVAERRHAELLAAIRGTPADVVATAVMPGRGLDPVVVAIVLLVVAIVAVAGVSHLGSSANTTFVAAPEAM